MRAVSRVILWLQLLWLLPAVAVFSMPAYCAQHCSTGPWLISWILVGGWFFIEFFIGTATALTSGFLVVHWLRGKREGLSQPRSFGSCGSTPCGVGHHRRCVEAALATERY